MAENVFDAIVVGSGISGGAFMTSSACQNPSLSYMAFTARAANYAVEELTKMNL